MPGVPRMGMRGEPGGGEQREPHLNLLHFVAFMKGKRLERNVTEPHG